MRVGNIGQWSFYEVNVVGFAKDKGEVLSTSVLKRHPKNAKKKREGVNEGAYGEPVGKYNRL